MKYTAERYFVKITIGFFNKMEVLFLFKRFLNVNLGHDKNRAFFRIV